ncbi:hypothetical protein [Flavobacterium sp. F52]|uniref:hypothetical protein n=1 Tax=Flavobacterium sp. F52 TaxID=1202532 RepID=UPI0002F13F0D|nr:hypothetical protein [Flavobacterium sp. F52]
MAGIEYIIFVVVFLGGLVPTLITLWLNEKVKGSVQNFFNKKLEELKKEHSKELSQFQAELNYLKSKENFKFTKLHERRFDVLQKTFEYLNNNLNLLASLTAPFKILPHGQNYDESEQLASQKYREAHNEFLKYFNHNSIYFDEETEALLLNFFRESGNIFNAYDQKQIYKSVGEKLDREGHINFANAHKKIPEIIHPLKKQIETKFRELLGE